MYAGSILHGESGGINYGYLSGSGISASANFGTDFFSSGVNTSLGYANGYNSATQNGTSTYPAQFTAASLYAVPTQEGNAGGFVQASRYMQITAQDWGYSSEVSSRVPTAAHWHTFTEGTGADAGKIFIGQAIPATRAYENQHFFNIADTQFYKDHVSAQTVASIAYQTTGESSYNTFDAGFDADIPFTALYSLNDKLYGRVRILNENNGLLKTIRVQMPDRYSAGQTAEAETVAINSVITKDGSTPVYVDSSKRLGQRVTITASSEHSGTVTRDDLTVVLDATEPYNAGKTAYEPTSVTASRNTPDSSIVWNATNKTVSADYTITAKNQDEEPVFTDSECSITIPATKAYNAGRTDEAGTVAIDSVTTKAGSTPVYVDSSKRLGQAVTITASSETRGTITKDLTVTLDATEPYNAGKTAADAAVSVDPLDPTLYYPSSAAGQHYVQDGSHYVQVTGRSAARARKSDGTYTATGYSSPAASFNVPADKVYSDGRNDGIDIGAATARVGTVTVGRVGTPSYSEANARWEAAVPVVVTTKGKKSDNTDVAGSGFSQNVTANVTDVYGAGVTAGAETATVSAMNIGAASGPGNPDENSRRYSTVSATATARGTRFNGSYFEKNVAFSNRQVDVTAVYNAVSISSSVKYSDPDKTYTNIIVPDDDVKTGLVYDSASQKWLSTLQGEIKVALSNGKEGYYKVCVDRTKAYEAGRSSVTPRRIKALTFSSGYSTYSMVDASFTDDSTPQTVIALPKITNADTGTDQTIYDYGLYQGKKSIYLSTLVGSNAPSGTTVQTHLIDSAYVYKTTGYSSGVQVGCLAGKAKITIRDSAGTAVTDYYKNISLPYGNFLQARNLGTISTNGSQTIGVTDANCIGLSSVTFTVDVPSSASSVTVDTVTEMEYSDTGYDKIVNVYNENVDRFGSFLYGEVNVTLTNGNTCRIKVGLAEDKAWQAGRSYGRTEGENAVSINSTGSAGINEDNEYVATVSSDTNTVRNSGYLSGNIRIRLTNGVSKVVRVNIPEHLSWNAGIEYAQANTTYTISDEKSGPYGSRQRDVYIYVCGVLVATAKVQYT